MTEIVTYHSTNAKPERSWTAHVVLPNGEYWGVRFDGSTEESVRTKAKSFWDSERSRSGLKPSPLELKPRVNSASPSSDDPWNTKPLSNDPWGSEKQHHFAGKIWMRHATEGLKRVPLTEITMYEKQGYYRSGPRGK